MQRCQLCEDTSAKQTLSGQESAQYCCQSKQDPSTNLPPGMSQVGVRKSWKGKRGPGGRQPQMAVTFARFMSQDQNPLTFCRAPSHLWVLPGNSEWLGRWDSCQPCCWKTSQHQLTLDLSARIHLLSPVSCLASQHLEAGGSVWPSSVQHPAVGLSPCRGDKLAQSQGNPKVQPCPLQQEGAFSAERSPNCAASLSCLQTIMWILLCPKRRHRLIPCAPPKAVSPNPLRKNTHTGVEMAWPAVVFLGLVCSQIWKMGINMC